MSRCTAGAHETTGHVDYRVIFGLLSLFTAMEVGIAVLPDLPEAIKIAVLIFLAASKVGLVVLFFMHLRHDSRVFALPVALAAVIAVPLILLIALSPPKSGSETEVAQDNTIQDGGSAPGEGQQLVQEKCSQCHGLDRIENATYDRQGWTTVVDQMISYGCPIDDQERDVIIDYLASTGGSAPAAQTGTPQPTPQATMNEAGSRPQATAVGEDVVQQADAEVSVTESSFAIEVDPASTAPGLILFRISNEADDLPHNLAIIRTDINPRALPTDEYGDVVLDELDIVLETAWVAPGESQDFAVDLSPGSYVLISTIPNRYDRGMVASLTVELQP